MSTARLTQRIRLRLFAAVIIVATAWISFTSLANLASHFGFGPRAWLFPITVDAVAAFGMDIWLVSRSPHKTGRNLALFAILCSIVGNVCDWLISQGSWQAGVLGAVPPAMLAWVLLTLHRHHADQPARQPAEPPRPARRAPQRPSTPAAPAAPATPNADATPTNRDEPRRTPTTPPPARRPATRGSELDPAIVAALVAQLEQGEPVTKRTVMSGYRVGNTKALAYVQAAKTAREQQEAAA